MKITSANVVAWGLLVALISCTGFLTCALWQCHLWKEEVSGLAAYQGIARAKEDYRAGKLQLFVLEQRRGDHFHGSNDGPFKVSAFSAHPFDYPSRCAAASLVKSYNRRMRSLHDHPEWYVAGISTAGFGAAGL